MYRKSDLRKSVSDSQILATYTWTLPRAGEPSPQRAEYPRLAK